MPRLLIWGEQLKTMQDAFMGARYWPQLDGLRTISIAIVFLSHMGDPAIWSFLNGALGVTLFFVISGFLITSLLIREERRRGKIPLSKFYIRRAFRILPLYYLALSTAIVAVYVFKLGAGSANFSERLPLIATFNGEFAGSGTFVHSWSLGIEEKFYIVWPLLAFALPFVRTYRLHVATGLLAFTMVAAYIDGFRYFGIYTAITAGVVLAITMHTTRGFAALSKLATPPASTALLAVAVAAFVIDPILPGAKATGHSHVLFAIATALAFPGIILGTSVLHKALTWRPMVYLGTRTYAIYLFHPFCIDVVGKLIPEGQTSLPIALVRLVLAAVVSLAAAEVLFRLIEGPLIKVGRRLTSEGAHVKSEAQRVSA